MPTYNALDEIQDRLSEIYNQERFLREDIAQRERDNRKDRDKLLLLEVLESQYLALLAPHSEGTKDQEKVNG